MLHSVNQSSLHVCAGVDWFLNSPFAVPGPVANVNTSRMSDEVVLVNWSAPEEPNGILQQYILVYRIYDPVSEDMEINVSVPNTSSEIPGLCESCTQPSAYCVGVLCMHIYPTVSTCMVCCH